MKKKIFAVALAAVMAITSAAAVFAEEVTDSKTYDGGLVVDGSAGWNSQGGDQYVLTGDFDVTIQFTNNAFIRDADNWSNYIIETAASDEAAGITLRADAYGWTYGDNTDNIPTYTVETSWGDDWDAFKASCPGEVSLNAKKTAADTVVLAVKFADGATETYTVVYPSGVPSTLGLFVGADGGKVTINSVTFGAEVADTEEPAGEEPADEAPADEAPVTETPAESTNTGDATTVAGIAVVALAAAAAVVVLKKRTVTE